jgi:bla regulator protein BlaR1
MTGVVAGLFPKKAGAETRGPTEYFAFTKDPLRDETRARARVQRELSCSRRFPYHRITHVVTLRRNLAFLSTALMAIGVTAAQSAGVPDRQTAAGGKMAFEIASVKSTKRPKFPSTIFPLDTGNAKTAGGRFSATFPLLIYVAFAYKLPPAEISRQLPKGFSMDDLFEIEVRAEGNPTKDQMRLMMQSLLADRFKLRVHFETREGSVFALILVRPGDAGPKLRPHADGPPCPDSFDMDSMKNLPRNSNDAFPPMCGVIQSTRTANATLLGARDTTVGTFAEAIYSFGSLTGEVDKPVVDQTRLKGRYDFRLELPVGTFSFSLAPPNPDAPPADPKGTPFLNALREQLGLKLVSSKGSIRNLVIDHAEPPSGN